MPALILGSRGKGYLTQALKQTSQTIQALELALQSVEPTETWQPANKEIALLKEVLKEYLLATPRASRRDHIFNRHLQRCLRRSLREEKILHCQGNFLEHRIILTAPANISLEVAERLQGILESFTETHFPGISYLPLTQAQNIAYAYLGVTEEDRRILVPLLCRQFEQEASGIFAEVVMIGS